MLFEYKYNQEHALNMLKAKVFYYYILCNWAIITVGSWLRWHSFSNNLRTTAANDYFLYKLISWLISLIK